MISLYTMPGFRRGFLRTSCLLSVLTLSAASLLLGALDMLSLAAGLGVGVGDNFIMLKGIESSAKKGGAAALAGMKKNMLKRAAFVGFMFLLAIKARANALLLFLAFLLIHGSCLAFFIIKARGRD